MKNGFVTLIGLLIAVLIISFFILGMGNKKENSKGQIDIYKDAVLDAEKIKNNLESSLK